MALLGRTEVADASTGSVATTPPTVGTIRLADKLETEVFTLPVMQAILEADGLDRTLSVQVKLSKHSRDLVVWWRDQESLVLALRLWRVPIADQQGSDLVEYQSTFIDSISRGATNEWVKFRHLVSR